MYTFTGPHRNGFSAKRRMSKPPIFIVGAPRSGTTLLRNLLNRHPKLAICGETRFYHYIYTRRRAFGDLSNRENRRRLVEEYLSTERAERLGMNLLGLGERLLSRATGYREFFTCLLEQYAESQGKQRSGEKTPHHALFAETLCKWYPGAVILHLVRDPRDVVASLQRMQWASNSVVANAWMWKQCNVAALRSAHRPEYLLVHYEPLVTQPEHELAKICAFADEDFDPCMLLPDRQPPPNRSQLRPHQQAVTLERRGTWRELLTPDEVSLIEWAVGPHLPAFGYERAHGPAPRLKVARAISFAAIDGIRKQITEFPGIWYHLAQPTKIAREEYWKHRREFEQEGISPTRWRFPSSLGAK